MVHKVCIGLFLKKDNATLVGLKVILGHMERLRINEDKLSVNAKKALDLWRMLEAPWKCSVSMVKVQEGQSDNYEVEILVNSPADGDSICQILAGREVRLRWSQGFAFDMLDPDQDIEEQMHIAIDVLSQLWGEQVILVKFREDDGPMKAKVVDIAEPKELITQLRQEGVSGSVEMFSFHGRWNSHFKIAL